MDKTPLAFGITQSGHSEFATSSVHLGSVQFWPLRTRRVSCQLRRPLPPSSSPARREVGAVGRAFKLSRGGAKPPSSVSNPGVGRRLSLPWISQLWSIRFSLWLRLVDFVAVVSVPSVSGSSSCAFRGFSRGFGRWTGVAFAYAEAMVLGQVFFLVVENGRV